jgi:hypothetical protein
LKRWREWEEKFAGYVSGHVQKRSGGLWYARMDVVGNKFIWSLKDTIGNSFSIKNSDLDEVAFNARKQGAIPGMAVRVNNEEYAILKMDDLIALLESDDGAIIDKEKNKIKREVIKTPPLLRK